MCGITGMLIHEENGYNNSQMEMLMSSMFMNQLRGGDSTGIVAISNKGDVNTLKSVGTPQELWMTKEWDEIYKEIFRKGKITFTHGRAATKGTVNQENAHPFWIEKPNKNGAIVLVHNGTLHAYQTLPGLDKHNVDSEWLTSQIATIGAEEALSHINGPIATIWWDSELNTINCYRNHERPLFTAVDQTSGLVLMNSTIESLMYLRYKYNLRYEVADVKTFTPKQWYSRTLDKLEGPWQGTVIKDKPVAAYYGNSSRMRDDDYNIFPLAQRISSQHHGQGVIPNKDWSHLERGADQDAQMIMDGQMISVLFEHGGRRTHMSNGSFWTPDVVPYERDLISMMKVIGENSIVYNFKGKDNICYTATRAFMPTSSPTKVETKKSDDTAPGFVSSKKWKLNQKVQFQTLAKAQPGVLGEVVHHYGKLSDSHIRHFTRYGNNDDGDFKIGDIITVELYGYNLRNHFLEVSGVRMTDKHVGAYFYVSHNESEKWRACEFAKGKIKMIKLATEEEFRLSGFVVTLMLDEVQDIDDQLAQVVVPSNKESTNASENLSQ